MFAVDNVKMFSCCIVRKVHVESVKTATTESDLNQKAKTI